MSNREKPVLIHIVAEAALPVIIGLLLSTVIQWFTMESAIVNVSPSVELDGQYLTVISVHNLKEKTLSKLSLYIDSKIAILDIKSNDQFERSNQYVELESISPKGKCSAILWTQQPILQDQIIAEANYKIRCNYSSNSSPFVIEVLWSMMFSGVVMTIGMSLVLWFITKQSIKIENKVRIAEKESKELSAQIDIIKKDTAKDISEIRIYYSAHISDLRKELSFWRDTVRKMLYNSQNEFQTADKVIDTVTSTLKTYTTRKRSKENMDELLYLAQLIADSRELHGKHDSVDSKKDI